MDTNPSIAVAVAILHFGDPSVTERCLHAIDRVRWPSLRVWLLLNGTPPGDLERLGATGRELGFPLELIQSPTNTGFAGGSDRLVEHILRHESAPECVMLLNNDAVVDEESIGRLLKALRGEGLHWACPTMLRLNADGEPSRSIDNLGLTLYRSGVSGGRKTRDDILLGPSGGCVLFSRQAIEALRRPTGYLFDADFFCYGEDTDLALRARRLGLRGRHVPDATVYHSVAHSTGGGYNEFILYYGLRNSLLALLRNLSVWHLIRMFPYVLVMQIAVVARHLADGRLPTVGRAYRDIVLRLPRVMKTRAVLQRSAVTREPLSHYVSARFYERGYIARALGIGQHRQSDAESFDSSEE